MTVVKDQVILFGSMEFVPLMFTNGHKNIKIADHLKLRIIEHQSKMKWLILEK